MRRERFLLTQCAGEDVRIPRHLTPPDRLAEGLKGQLDMLERNVRARELQRRRGRLRLWRSQLLRRWGPPVEIEGGVQSVDRCRRVVDGEAQRVLQVNDLRVGGRAEGLVSGGGGRGRPDWSQCKEPERAFCDSGPRASSPETSFASTAMSSRLKS